jgi:hypothetical protein
MERIKLVALAIFAMAVAGFIGADLPRTPIGHFEVDVILWLALFPFVSRVAPTKTHLYWLVPVALVPLHWLALHAGSAAPFLTWGAFAFVAFAILVLIVKNARGGLRRT